MRAGRLRRAVRGASVQKLAILREEGSLVVLWRSRLEILFAFRLALGIFAVVSVVRGHF